MTVPAAAGSTWLPTLAVRLSAGLHGAAAVAAVAHPAWWPGALAAVAGNHAVLAVGGMLPRSTMLGPVLHRLDGADPVAVLTFDDGPDPATTPRVLDLLAAHGATASFFCIGERARQHPALLRRMAAEGHRVENHSRTHPRHFAFLGGAALRREVDDAQAILADVTGTPPSWFRAPMGIRSPLLHPVLVRAGLGLAAWTRRGFDTRCGTPDIVLRRLARDAAPGDVLLLHDGGAARAPEGGAVAVAVLPRLLAALGGQGLRAVSLPCARAATASAGGTPPSAGYAST